MATVVFNPTGKVTITHQRALEELIGVYVRQDKHGHWFGGKAYKSRKELCEAMLYLAHGLMLDTEQLLEVRMKWDRQAFILGE